MQKKRIRLCEDGACEAHQCGEQQTGGNAQTAKQKMGAEQRSADCRGFRFQFLLDLIITGFDKLNVFTFEMGVINQCLLCLFGFVFFFKSGSNLMVTFFREKLAQ